MQWLSNATTETFEQEVLARSRELVVLVDFWADWCAPCRTLAPELEAAVEARAGRVWLVKLDTETNQELAAQLGIRGIPAVKAFFDGHVVDEFVGLLPRVEIDAFIDRVCPSAEEQTLATAEAALAQGRPAEALAAALTLGKNRRYGDGALLIAARAQLAIGELGEARATLARIPERSEVAEAAAALDLRLGLFEAAAGRPPGELTPACERDPADLDARWALAGALVVAGSLGPALEQLLEILRSSRRFRDDGARRAMLMIFDELGPDSDLARDYRRQLQILL